MKTESNWMAWALGACVLGTAETIGESHGYLVLSIPQPGCDLVAVVWKGERWARGKNAIHVSLHDNDGAITMVGRLRMVDCPTERALATLVSEAIDRNMTRSAAA